MKYSFQSKDKTGAKKGTYIIFMFLILFIVFWAQIDATAHNLPILSGVQFYLGFGFVMGLIPILISKIKPKDTIQVLETTTIEEPRHPLLSPRNQIIIGVIVMAMLSFRILTTNSAWIPYPSYQIFEGKLASALMSGVFGIMEDWVFFGFAFTTILAGLKVKFGDNEIVALVPSLVLIGVIFMTYHIFVYSAQITALTSVFTFAIFSASMCYATRSLIISNFLHASNNVVASLISAQVGLIF